MTDKNYVRPMEWLWALAKAEAPAKARIVASFMLHDVEIIYQSIDYMTGHTPECSKSTVQRGVRWLIDHGWLDRIAVGSSFGRGGFSSQYRRLMPGEKVLPLQVKEGFKSGEAYKADREHTLRYWAPGEWNASETGVISDPVPERAGVISEEQVSDRTAVPAEQVSYLTSNRNTPNNRDRENSDTTPRGASPLGSSNDNDSGKDAALDMAQPTSEACGSVLDDIVPHDSLEAPAVSRTKYFLGKRGTWRKAGKSKPRPGEVEKYLTPEEIQRYTDD